MKKWSVFPPALLGLVVGLFVLANAGELRAGGMYYTEKEQGGVVFVFNDAAKLASWQKTGAVDGAIQRERYGPHGEKVVFDSAAAIDLYNFKHDLPGESSGGNAAPPPAPIATPAASEFRVGHEDGKTVIETKGAKVTMQNRIQARYTLAEPEVGDRVGSFRIRRLHTIFEGTFSGYWKAKVQVNWTGQDTVSAVTSTGGTVTTSRNRSPVLDDAEIQWTRFPLATVWAGQGKVFFGRQELTSDAKLQFVDRTITSARFAPPRDQGVGLLGATKDKRFEYQIALYNGNGPNQAANDNARYATAERIVWMPLGEFKLEESSLDYPEHARLALGVSALQNVRGTGAQRIDVARTGIEAAFKLRGFNLVGELYRESADPTAVGPTVDADGYYAQAGFLFPNRKFELAGRYARVRPDTSSSGRTQEETGGALSWYFDRHNHKLQADYRELRDERTRTTDREFRLQLQIVF